MSTFWVRTFALARLGVEGADSTGWYCVERTYTRLSAQQLVSDITNSHRRPSGKVRVRGMLPGEIWAAKAESCDAAPGVDYMVYVRCLGSAEGE